ncbi:uncharacterized protein LOC135094309 [Scylla paramamosain]|uniref:uncharacterized protein LOC135094309 n=1 Tax=Scylla paramamosain TaxID=85552 RepID=UPI003083B06A
MRVSILRTLIGWACVTYRQTPVFLLGDLNARHPYLGYTTTNQVGTDIVDYLRRHTACHIGPHFPTFFNHQTSSPDIALTNRANFLHCSLSSGPLTTSDHVPVILDISTSPILIPSTKTFTFHRTDWDAFKEDDALQMTELPDVSHGTLEKTDDALETWMTTLLRIQFRALRDRAMLRGWTYDDYRQYSQLKVALQDSRRTEAREHWGRRLAGLAASSRDPRKEDYDDDFDDNDLVLDYISTVVQRTYPYDNADPDRLTDSALFQAIFNAALSAGYFPDGFKQAEMRMIPKAGKPLTHPESYRPISLLEVSGKLLERIVTSRLRVHLEAGNHLHPTQYGFRSGRGTVHAIALATETMGIHQAGGFRCNLVLRDVSKAFDRVWHLGLKYKILHLGLPAPVERLLCDFLDDRSARVRVGSHLGPAVSLATGVPQGSVISPMLYSIYTSDCPVSDAGINVLYADDVSQVVFHPGRSSRMLNARTGREIARINAFEREWRIRTNMAKFTVITLATKTPTPLLVDGDDVGFRPRGSTLGLVRLIHGALILPILTYPPVPLHALSKIAISRLQKVQNSALRFALDTRWDDFTTTASLHEAASLPALNVRLHEMAAKKRGTTTTKQHPSVVSPLRGFARPDDTPGDTDGNPPVAFLLCDLPLSSLTP